MYMHVYYFSYIVAADFEPLYVWLPGYRVAWAFRITDNARILY